MKNILDAARHQREKEINILARMVVEKDFSMERVMEEIDQLWPGRTGRERERYLSMVIHKCHESVWPARAKTPQTGRAFILDDERSADVRHMNRCFALSLFRTIMESIGSCDHPLCGGVLPEEFYARCAAEILDKSLSRAKDDPELLVIYLKQMVIILKSAGFIGMEGGSWRVSGKSVGEAPYQAVFNAFWNQVRWEDIFPSMPDAAVELKRNRGILLDIMMRRSGGFAIDALAREFFDLTGFCGSDDIILISFLDFYFFTWLEHFALLEYDDAKEGPVTARITGLGRRFFARLQGL